MTVRHQPTDSVLADDVQIAQTFLETLTGLRGRDSMPDGEALVLEAGGGRQLVDMLGVGCPLDVLWLREGRVEHAKTLRPWLGVGVARADTIVELPAGAAEQVAVGDGVWVAYELGS